MQGPGKIDIHAVSALSIRDVAIKPGNHDQPIAIEVDMSGEAGIFQVEQTLVRKLLRTALRDQITVRACVHDPDSSRPHLIDCVALTERKLKPHASLSTFRVILRLGEGSPLMQAGDASAALSMTRFSVLTLHASRFTSSRLPSCSKKNFAASVVQPVWWLAPTPRAVVAVEVLVEQHVVAPVRIVLEAVRCRRRPAAGPCASRQENAGRGGWRQLVGHLAQRDQLPGAGRALDLEGIAVVVVVAAQRLDDQDS
ncbi:MAG: hypothetical protein V9H69_19305 [Anaerolineae bacterium]